MKVVILAGGLGSRISEESHLKPKPMIEIGNRPILWHIMSGYTHFGFDDFVICAGYKQDKIKEYFNSLYLYASDIAFDFRGGSKSVEIMSTEIEPWRVTIADTGLATQTAGRIKRVRKYVGDETFMLTYGDGVSNVDPEDILDFHKREGGLLTITAVRPQQRFGVLDIEETGQVVSFHEKRSEYGSYVNGGFMVCEPEIFDIIGSSGIAADDEDFSSVTMERLAREGKVTAYRHDGFWMCMDTRRDRQQLEELWAKGDAPWKVW